MATPDELQRILDHLQAAYDILGAVWGDLNGAERVRALDASNLVHRALKKVEKVKEAVQRRQPPAI